MDGGGRVLEPLTVGYSGGGSRARSASSIRIPSPFAPFGGKRRRSAADALARRLPAAAAARARPPPANLGAGLTLVLFAAIAAYGAVAGGHFAAFREASG